MKQGLPRNCKYKVRIQCSTYNHSCYIEDTLRGFSMQQTNFPFVCCVMDDASTDGEQEVLRRWIDNHCNAGDVEVYDHPLAIVFMAPDRENRNCIYAIHLLKYNTWGKPERLELLEHWRKLCEYEARCEGDDYWTDPLKLQKQVDILENNEEYGCVYTAYKTIDTMGNPIEFLPSRHHMNRSYTGDIFYELLVDNFPQTLTVMFRKGLIERFSPPYNFDYAQFLSIAIQKKFYYIPEVTGAYRINPRGMVQSGALRKRFDFISVKLYFYIEYLRNKCYRRSKCDDKKIRNVIYDTKIWNIQTLRRYFPYFMKIVYYRPYDIVRLVYSIVVNTFEIIIKKLRFLK